MSHANPERSLPLDERIRDVEVRLAERRRSARAHLATTKERGRDALISPKTLLLAFGGGIVLGQVTSPSRRQAPNAAARETRPAADTGLLSMLLDALRISAPIVHLISAMHSANKPPAPPSE